jgi:hypothetical protein
MKTGRPRRRPLLARVAQNAVGQRTGAPYGPPSLATLPPKPAWLKLGASVAVLRPVSDKCAAGVVATVYEIRPTADGVTWEAACSLRGAGLGRFRLKDPQEIVEWENPRERDGRRGLEALARPDDRGPAEID